MRFFRILGSFLKDIVESVANRLPTKIRKKFCGKLGHRYNGIWFKSDDPGCYAGIADVEAGCKFCGYSEPNKHPIDIEEIDWKKTFHRKEPPKHCVYCLPKNKI